MWDNQQWQWQVHYATEEFSALFILKQPTYTPLVFHRHSKGFTGVYIL